MTKGAAWAVEHGYGQRGAPRRHRGRRLPPGRRPVDGERRAKERGLEQIGTLGSGNHFAELGVVEEIFHPEAAAEFGLVRAASRS